MKEQERKVAATFSDYVKSAAESISVFKWIWRETTTPESRKKIKQVMIFLLIIVSFQSVQPIVVSFIFNGLTTHNGAMVKWSIGIFFLFLLLQKITSRFHESAREWVISIHSGKIDERITEMFFEKSIGQHIHEGNTLSISNIEKGRHRAVDIQNHLLFEGADTVIQLTMAFIGLCILNWVAGCIMGGIILVYIVWSLYLNFRVVRACAPIDRDMRRLNRRRVERWERIERVKMSCKEETEIEEMSATYDEISNRDRSFWLWFIKVANVRSMVNIVGLTAIMAWGSWLVWTGKWNIGLLYPLFTWSNRVSENIWRFGALEHNINWNMPAIKSMIEALEIPPTTKDVPDATDIDPAVPHSIEFAGVSHTYPAESKKKVELEDLPPAIVKVNFSIGVGEKVALLGSSGAGKTTVMRKLLRFDDPTAGSILVDGTDLRQISQKSWRKGIGYIPQQAQVFDGSIRYNLTYSLTEKEKATLTDDDLWKLMKLLQIDFEDRLTDGLDTIVGKNGIKLSGGQAQRLMIGAAVVKKPWLLVVDEATSSLDSTTERKVQEGLGSVLSGTTTSALIVAHRLSTVRHLCTKFIVLKPVGDVVNGDSQVEASASSFEELYKISPTFRQLANDQGITVAVA